MKIKVLLVMPGKEVQLVKIPASIKFIKSFIGEELFRIKLSENIILIADKNAKIDEFNRIFAGNVILGSFLIISIRNKHRVSMKKKDIRKYSNMFKLAKHIKKVSIYKENFLEEYYSKQKELKELSRLENKNLLKRVA